MDIQTKKMKSDIDIANESYIKPIMEIADELDILDDEIELYGKYKAKLSLNILERLQKKPDGKLILVTAINPTKAGEGKTTVTVGLADAFTSLGEKAMIAMREPSLGPVMGIKGGAAGGGYSQVLPMTEINLHFNGDIHAITAANNTLAALIDNHLHQGNTLGIDPRKIVWKRVMDINDRALRNVVVGLGGPMQGIPREDGFDISVASEIMAVVCLAEDLQDMKERLARMVVAWTYNDQPVTVQDLGVEGALALLLKDAIKPNIVQTIAHTPALIHGGPFANIAHGCNSAIATRTALKLADYVVTEAGFGADLGAEKFLNIKSRIAGLKPDAVVIVATIRALKMHGGVNKNELSNENIGALKKGIENLKKHRDTISSFGLPYVVALNRFVTDTQLELEIFKELMEEEDIPFALTEVWEKGGSGGTDLAESIKLLIDEKENKYAPLYELTHGLEDKITIIAKKVYGAEAVDFTPQARKKLVKFIEQGWDHLPVCMAKTQYSLSDNPEASGRPSGFTITIRDMKPSIGAGFIVALTGEIMTMPGLPKLPAALNMDVTEDGKAIGLF
ncbi:formate--tetrahydrofolate ligase [Peribacillus deserti]|uniref:Formate--tetrahydrofolate ligase n=1 Tax=Peribacillus deserti TaxID=673318 RepID=A0ABS2QHH9_9BACI|nr:formate--tetrahydrofolate ligase [Peribacillus deserti]MBM7692562.1 formate--tetrahydrofolate ligase [Peribacillus deserti]